MYKRVRIEVYPTSPYNGLLGTVVGQLLHVDIAGNENIAYSVRLDSPLTPDRHVVGFPKAALEELDA